MMGRSGYGLVEELPITAESKVGKDGSAGWSGLLLPLVAIKHRQH